MWHSAFVSSVFASAVLAAFVTAGCGAPQANVSESKHDVDEPTRGTDAWMWKSASDGTFQRLLAQMLGVDENGFLDQDHSLVKRTQFWVDRIDAQLRAAHPSDLVNTPKPVAKVLKEASSNAFIAPLPVCYKLPVKLRSGTATPESTVDNVYLDLATGSVSAWPAEIECVIGTEVVPTIKAVAAKFNAANTDCKLNVSNSGSLVPTDGCERGSDIEGMIAAKNVVLLQTASFLTVHTGIFGAMTEEAFVSVVAHELGHYYRSHVTVIGKDFDFFYTMDQNQPARRPTAEPERQELGEGAVMGSTLLNASDTYRTATSAKLRPELYFAAGSLVLQVCDAGSCADECKAASDYIKSTDFDAAMNLYPFSEATSEEAQAYSEFETKTLACLSQIDIESASGTLSATKVSWDKVLELVQAPIWPAWLEQVGANPRRMIANLSALAALRLGDDAPATTNAKDAFLSGSKLLRDQDDESVNLLKLANTERVGQYTSEQEADDEAAEWVAETGIDPKHVVDAMRRLGDDLPTSLRGMSLGSSDCEALWQNDWLDANGNYVFVPIGDYSEVHHSVCYRMFNLEREIAAHEHVTSPNAAPVLTATQWLALQTEASGLSEDLESNDEDDDLPVLHPVIRRVMSCPYAHHYH